MSVSKEYRPGEMRTEFDLQRPEFQLILILGLIFISYELMFPLINEIDSSNTHKECL